MPTAGNKWSTDFGLYKYDDLKKESTTTKFVVIVTTVGIILFTVFYLCIFLFKNTPITNTAIEIQEKDTEKLETEATIFTLPTTLPTVFPTTLSAIYSNSTIAAEKLVGGANLGTPLRQPPSPFINHIRGPSPASFLPLPTERVAAILPQLQNYNRPGGFPRNIQDIINYIGVEKPIHETFPKKPFTFPKHHDPFFPYKPKDPSDINLMATANLRFAPPSWKEIKTNLVPSQSIQKPEPHQLLQHNQFKRQPKPVTLSLNIFPMPNDAKHQNFYGFTSNANPRFVGNGRRKPRKMIIHLNVYGNQDIFERDDEEAEGTVQDQDLVMLRDLASEENEMRDDVKDFSRSQKVK